ncbi:hypothetical protein KZJ38_07455 [Paraburkholderia edwinii]|uniref:Phage protein n=1 Tax=Paraburkholderia edwinii TaxID=2861782 RepID=A0ABX8UT94_9BURK|nr:hypothetical protein [Paraburkholderia edwinii]QYD70135.1 hypothetical protein KZJ38_07455 [Paraburkholderia edwinii]
MNIAIHKKDFTTEIHSDVKSVEVAWSGNDYRIDYDEHAVVDDNERDYGYFVPMHDVSYIEVRA